jgi:hypothetical protein
MIITYKVVSEKSLQENREGIEQGREEGVNVFYSSSLRCKKKNPHKLLTSGLWGAIIPASTTLDNNQLS